MTDPVKEEVKKKDKPKGPLGKIKDAILPDAEEQAAIISTAVRITVLAWSGGILTLNYVSIPGVPQQKIDPTFIASIFVSISASFGANIQQKGEKNGSSNGKNIKAELKEALGDVEIVGFKHKVELVPVKTKIDPITNRTINDQGRLS